MKHKQLVLILLLSFVFWSACTTASRNDNQTVKETPKMMPTTTATERDYSKNLEDLRERFNRDKGKVRLVTLLSPT